MHALGSQPKPRRGSERACELEKVVGLTGFVTIHVFIASFSPAQGECNQMVNTEFTRPVNGMPMSNVNITRAFFPYTHSIARD